MAKRHTCEKGITDKCIKEYPEWARKAIAYKLIHFFLPKELSRNLPFPLNRPLIGEGAVVPAGVDIPAGYVIPPEFDASGISGLSDLPASFSPEGASGVVCPPDTGASPPDVFQYSTPARLVSPVTSAEWRPSVFCGDAEVASYVSQLGTYMMIGNRCFLSGHVEVADVGSAIGAVTIRGLPSRPVYDVNHRQAVAIVSDGLKNIIGASIQAQIKETYPQVYIYSFYQGDLFPLVESNLQSGSVFDIFCIYEI